MRILHTSDWHLGHTLHGVGRDYEHDRFLSWLIDTLQERAIDALIIAGDVFDSANPPASAEARWYGFLAELRRRMPALDVVVIGGNHDSAARLDAPVPLLQAMRVHVVGGLPRRHDAIPALYDRLIVPLTDANGRVAAHIAAVPFLRPADLPRPMCHQQTAIDVDADAEPEQSDPLIEGVRRVYADVLDAARARCEPSQALLATGHCYMVGTDISMLSERRILGGNQHALPVDIFAGDIAYVALGHLHKAQRVGRLDHIRYSGSPIALAMNEARYRHQVCMVELRGTQLDSVESVPVPRAVDMIRLPRTGSATLAEILSMIEALPEGDEPGGDRVDSDRDSGTGEAGARTAGPGQAERDIRPYLEVCVVLVRPEPNLRQRIEQALDGKKPRLLKLSIEYTGTGMALAEAAPEFNLRDIDPSEVFLRCYHRDHAEDPEPELVAAFHELLDQVEQGGAR